MSDLQLKVLSYVMQHPLSNDVAIGKGIGVRTRAVAMALSDLRSDGKVEGRRVKGKMLWSVVGGVPVGPRVALYARVSTADQDETLQLPRLREYAASRGYTVIGEYTDEASGKDLRRPGWASLLESVKAGSLDMILVVKLDRIVRNLQLLLSELELLGSYEVKLMTLDMGVIDPISPAGRLQLQMIGAVAEWERGIISTRTKEALAVKKAKGVKLGRPKRDIPIHRIALLRSQGLNWKQIADIVDLPYHTIYEYRDEIEEKVKSF